MFENKELRVILSEEADEVFKELNKIVGEVTGNKLEIVTFIMDIFDHKNYDKVFGYKH